MKLVQKPAHPQNYNRRPGGAKISAIVYHDTGGSAESAISWFQNPKAQVSAHYIVALDGSIYQVVPELMRAWHAGESDLFGVRDVNSYSIGIEIEDKDDASDYPHAQLDALIELAVNISQRYQIPLNRHVGHCHICKPPGRKVDPGNDFPWWQFLNAVGAKLRQS